MLDEIHSTLNPCKIVDLNKTARIQFKISDIQNL